MSVGSEVHQPHETRPGIDRQTLPPGGSHIAAATDRLPISTVRCELDLDHRARRGPTPPDRLNRLFPPEVEPDRGLLRRRWCPGSLRLPVMRAFARTGIAVRPASRDLVGHARGRFIRSTGRRQITIRPMQTL